MAPVGAEEAQESLVVGVRHVEQAHDQAVVSSGPFEPLCENRFQVGPPQIAAHERLVHHRPERLAGTPAAAEQLANRPNRPARRRAAASRAVPVRRSRGTSSISTRGPADLSTIRSTTFRSWRTFPGQSYADSRSIASGDHARGDVRWWAARSTRGSARAAPGCPPRRSRRGGTMMWITSSR